MIEDMKLAGLADKTQEVYQQAGPRLGQALPTAAGIN